MGDFANERFRWLLTQRGYRYWTEDNLDEVILVRGKRPDFYVKTPHGDFLAEVKSFEKESPLRFLRQAMAYNQRSILKRIRKKVNDAAEQLRPYQIVGIPLLIVLDNWRRVGIPSNITDLLDALFGEQQLWVPISSSADAGPVQWHHAHGRVLSPDYKLYVSAVAWNLPRNPSAEPPNCESDMYVRMVHNPFGIAHFPKEIFATADDVHWGREGNAWIKL